MDTHETTAKHNLAETCAASISANDLATLGGNKDDDWFSLSQKLTYGSIRGSEKLRTSVSRLYIDRPIAPNNILITPGAILANFLVFYALIRPGDHVVCVYPTYAQLYSVPQSLGADVDFWRLREEKNWALNLEDLKRLVKSNTKLIVINNPNNPTGAIMQRPLLATLVEFAARKGITILSDEVYRPLFHSLPSSGADALDAPPSLSSFMAENLVVTGSLSKAFAMAGARVGWIASTDSKIIEACASVRYYSTISVSQLDDQLAAYALSSAVVGKLLARNLELARTNLTLLEAFVSDNARFCTWVKPWAGTTAFIKVRSEGEPVDDEEFCQSLQEDTGVMLVPGQKCFGEGVDFRGYVRIGYVCETEVLREGLRLMKGFLDRRSESKLLA